MPTSKEGCVQAKCPFFVQRDKGRVHCEGSVIKITDKDYRAHRCNHVTGWRDCMVARGLLMEYDAMEEGN